MNRSTQAYFDDLAARAGAAKPVPREPASDARPNDCHANCEAFVSRFRGYDLVRGWLVFGGCWFVPHSMVRQRATRKLIDITPEPGNTVVPFVEHLGSEQDFAVLRQGRDGGWLHPELDCISAG